MILDKLVGLWPILTGVFLATWLSYVVIHRRYFHPLSHVPGPFLWSVSSLPQFYHQGIREGQLMHVLPRLHAKYGPVVRISPAEVHLADPAAYETIHAVGTRFTKDPAFYSPMDAAFKTPVVLTVISNEAHRARRAPLNPFFSRRSVLELESVLWEKVGKLTGMMEAAFNSNSSSSGSGGLFDMHHAIRAFSVDVITEYAYARCWNQLDAPDFGMGYQDAIRAIQDTFPYLLTFSGIVVPLLGWCPDSVSKVVFPPMRKWFESLDIVREAVAEVKKEIAMGVKPPRRTIFHDLLESGGGDGDGDAEGEGVKLSDETVFADAVNLTGAGAETTGATAARGIFEVISHPDIYEKLSKELRDAFPDVRDMTIPALEKLPILTGVVKEALRLNPGIPGHVPRVVPIGGATFNGIPLPAETVVSMSAWILHHNVEAFPNPEEFDPYRWIDTPEKIHFRERCMIPFGRGTRNCIGQSLALSEIYASIAAIFHKFDGLEVGPNFSREDLAMVELFLGYHPKNARKFTVVKR